MTFPLTPSDGDEWVENGQHYVYDATVKIWRLSGKAGDHRDYNSMRLVNLADPINPGDAATMNYTDVLNAATVTYADTTFLPFTGGAMQGPILLPADPTLPFEAATRQFVQRTAADAQLWQGVYRVDANSPDLSVAVPLPGYSWTTITLDPAVPELIRIGLFGIPLGTMVSNGDLIVFQSAVLGWTVIHGSGLTLTEVDALFLRQVAADALFLRQTDADTLFLRQVDGVKKIGDNMSGALNIVAPTNVTALRLETPGVATTALWLTAGGLSLTNGNITLQANGSFCRFNHSNSVDMNDGRIGARMFSRGLNIVGNATEAGDTQRYVRVWGQLEDQNGTPYINQGGGDARYVQRAGSSMTGDLWMDLKKLYIKGPNSNTAFQALEFTTDGGMYARFDPYRTGHFMNPEAGLTCYVNAGGYGLQQSWYCRGLGGVGDNPIFWVQALSYGSATQRSDRTLKQDIVDVTKAQMSKAFDSFRPVRFRRKPPPKAEGQIKEHPPAPPEYGLVADDMDPELVTTIDGVKGYSISGVIAVLIAKIKELEAEIKTLKARPA